MWAGIWVKNAHCTPVANVAKLGERPANSLCTSNRARMALKVSSQPAARTILGRDFSLPAWGHREP